MILKRDYVKVVKKHATNKQVKGLRVFRALRFGCSERIGLMGDHISMGTIQGHGDCCLPVQQTMTLGTYGKATLIPQDTHTLPG